MKVYAFIDSQNLNLGVKSLGWKLDWRKFRQYLKNKYTVEKAFLFIGYIEENKQLYSFLESSGYTLIFKPTVQAKDGNADKTKGNVDAELVLHTMIELPHFDKAVIVTGDGDFRCLVEYLVQENKLLKLLTPTKRYSSLLKEFNKGRFIMCVETLQKSLKLKETGIRGQPKP